MLIRISEISWSEFATYACFVFLIGARRNLRMYRSYITYIKSLEIRNTSIVIFPV